MSSPSKQKCLQCMHEQFSNIFIFLIVCVFACVCGGQRSTSDLAPQMPTTPFLEAVFSWNQWALGTQLPQPLQLWVTSISHHVCTAMPGFFFFTWVLENPLRSARLPSKQLPNWVISLFRPVLWASGVKAQEKRRTHFLVYSPNVHSTVERKSTEGKLSSTGVFEPSSLSGY